MQPEPSTLLREDDSFSDFSLNYLLTLIHTVKKKTDRHKEITNPTLPKYLQKI